MCPEKPVLLKRCPNTQEKLWCDDGPKIRTPTITITPPSIHHAEIRFSSATRCEENTLIRLWAARMRKKRTNVWWRIAESLAVAKSTMKWRLYSASTEFRNDA